MSQAVHAMFAGIARRYDLANRLLSGGRDISWRRSALRRISCQPLRILDLACGTGDLSVDAQKYTTAQRVIGADFCLPMIQAGHEKFTTAGLDAATADALALPFADHSFDAALIAFGWRNVDNKRQALDELRRVLRPGGQLLILEFFRPANPWTHLFHATFSRFIIPFLGGFITGDRAAYRYLHTSIQGFLSRDEANQMIHDASFSDCQWQRHFGGVAHSVVANRD